MIELPPKNVAALCKFMIERQRIHTRRYLGKPKPWTSDPILQQYRFCNIYREQDKVTKWIAYNWRDPNNMHIDLWFAMLVARYINEPGTLKLLPFPLPWNRLNFHDAVNARKSAGLTVYNAAYIISTGGQAKPKHEYLGNFFDKFWWMRKQIRPREGDTLANFSERLVAVQGMGKFFSGQIIADVKYAEGSTLRKADDWWTFAVSGPGSRRGLNRVCNNPVDQGWNEGDWHAHLSTLRRAVNKEITSKGLEKLHAQDLQNSLCEFDKYLRVQNGEGRPKQKYDGMA